MTKPRAIRTQIAGVPVRVSLVRGEDGECIPAGQGGREYARITLGYECGPDQFWENALHEFVEFAALSMGFRYSRHDVSVVGSDQVFFFMSHDEFTRIAQCVAPSFVGAVPALSAAYAQKAYTEKRED